MRIFEAQLESRLAWWNAGRGVFRASYNGRWNQSAAMQLAGVRIAQGSGGEVCVYRLGLHHTNFPSPVPFCFPNIHVLSPSLPLFLVAGKAKLKSLPCLLPGWELKGEGRVVMVVGWFRLGKVSL